MAKKLIHYGILTIMTLTIIILSSWTAATAADTPTGASIRPPIIPEGAELPEEGFLLPKTPTGQVEEQYFGGTFLPAITRTVIEAAGIAAVLFIIIGGIQILTAYGNDEKIGKAKKTITYAIVGLLAAILSYAIVSIISAINLR